MTGSIVNNANNGKADLVRLGTSLDLESRSLGTWEKNNLPSISIINITPRNRPLCPHVSEGFQGTDGELIDGFHCGTESHEAWNR